MSVHMLDMAVFEDTLSTLAMREVFEENAFFQSWLDVEAALATTQGSLGMIPQASATAIAAAAKVERIDFEAVKAHGRETGHSLVPLLRELRRVAGPEHAGFVHWGATTQDIVDTGMMLMVKAAWGLAGEQMLVLMKALLGHMEAHRDTVMVGRSHGNHALPITFGFKVAGWLDELHRQVTRWEQAKTRVLVGSINGAVGTFAPWGAQGFEVQAETCRLLALGVPDAPWQSARDRTAEAATLCGLTAGTLSRIAQEIYLLAKTEVGELAEPFTPGMIGSSTMPHKRNPIRTEWVLNLTRMVRSNAQAMMEAMSAEHERDASRWRTEWVRLPESFLMLSGALAHLIAVAEGLQVNAGRMEANLGLERGLLFSEPAMFALAEAGLPLDQAHHKVYEAAQRVHQNGTQFLDELVADPEITSLCSRDALAAIMDPRAHTGLAGAVVDKIAEKTANLVRPSLGGEG